MNKKQLVNDSISADVIDGLMAYGSKERQVRSYAMPEYQLELLGFLAKENGMTQVAVLRTIVNEWMRQQLNTFDS